MNNSASICAVITEERVEGARAALRQAASVADMAEVRLDYLHDFDFTSLESLRSLLSGNPLPVIITCRDAAEGGRQRIEDPVRIRLLVEGARHLADYCDIEAAHYASAAALSPDLSRLIVSYHNFNETPSRLEAIYDRIRKLPAAIHKIATRANNISDTLTIFRLLDRAREEGRELIALAMGGPGLVTRVLGPSRGSFLTYCAVTHGAESAPGQLRCEELKHLYRLHEISRDTIITGIVGHTVSHSASPAMHNAAFRALGLDFIYLPLEVESAADFLAAFVRPRTRLIDWPLRGLSVTIPHKRDVISFLDEIDDTAAKIGAVNTIVVGEDRVKGFNTDVEGAIRPLEKACSLDKETCAVIGAGGAARAVLYGLIKQGASVTLYARDPLKARPLAEAFDVQVKPLGSFQSSQDRIVINASPVGMRGHSEDLSPVPPDSLRNRLVAYDLVYNPLETRFLKDARDRGCHTISGIEMLIEQAALQFELWTGHLPPLDLMRAAATEWLRSSSKRPRT